MTERTDIIDINAIGRGLILFDGECGLCRVSKSLSHRYLESLGFRFLAIQSPRAAALAGVTNDALLEELHVVTAEGKTLCGVDAILHLAEANPWLRPLSWLARTPGLKPMLNSAYGAFAQRRYRLSAMCRLDRPDPFAGLIRWGPPTLLLIAVLIAGAWLPAWGWMWTLSLSLYAAFKWITWYPARRLAPSIGRAFGYLAAWAGMDANAFFTGQAPARPTPADWLRAATVTAIGVALIWMGARSFEPRSPLVTGWIGMIGLAMAFHFGALQLLALAWQRAGVAAEPIMRRPLMATSLADFWGRRWNTAFHALARDLIFIPLLRRGVSVPRATVAVFVVSGLVHDLVISLPARSGFGLPTLYFVFQFLGLLLERTRPMRRVIRTPIIGWLWTLAFTLSPVALLFHAGFVRNVFLPFLRAIGALP